MSLATCISAIDFNQKAAQILVVHLKGEELTEDLESFLTKVPVGGIILYSWANGLQSLEKTKKFADDIRALFLKNGDVEPWLFVDQEGGRVAHLGVDSIPSQQEVGLEEDLKYAKEVSNKIAKDLKSAGISVDLAPVVDLAYGVFSSRNFSKDPERVTECAAVYLNAFHASGIAGCLKHFPGHGRAQIDSHKALPLIDSSYDALWEEDLKPFRELKSQADFIMTSHLYVPAIDPKNPITLSQKAVSNLLRNKMNYQGVVITDSLAMQGILEVEPTLIELAKKAFLAGHDLLLLGGKQLLKEQEGFEYGIEEITLLHKQLISWFRNNPKANLRLHESLGYIMTAKGV